MSDSFTLGKFTIQVSLRPDNPAFPAYRIFIGAKFIGKNFSRPCLTDCEWLERENGVYATDSRLLESSASQSSSAHDRRCRAGAAPASRVGRPPRKLATA